MMRVLYVNTDDNSHENLMEAGSRGFLYVVWPDNGGVLVSDIKRELDVQDADEIFEFMNDGRGDAYGSSEVTLSSGLDVKLEY